MKERKKNDTYDYYKFSNDLYPYDSTERYKVGMAICAILLIGMFIFTVVLATSSTHHLSFVSQDGIHIKFDTTLDDLSNAELVDYDYITSDAKFKTVVGDEVTYNLNKAKKIYDANAPVIDVYGMESKHSTIPGLDENTTNLFVDYLIKNQIYDTRIKVLDYNDETGILQYSLDDGSVKHTITMGTNGFYSNNHVVTINSVSNSIYNFIPIQQIVLLIILFLAALMLCVLCGLG